MQTNLESICHANYGDKLSRGNLSHLQDSVSPLDCPNVSAFLKKSSCYSTYTCHAHIGVLPKSINLGRNNETKLCD